MKKKERKKKPLFLGNPEKNRRIFVLTLRIPHTNLDISSKNWGREYHKEENKQIEIFGEENIQGREKLVRETVGKKEYF